MRIPLPTLASKESKYYNNIIRMVKNGEIRLKVMNNFIGHVGHIFGVLNTYFFSVWKLYSTCSPLYSYFLG